MTLTDYYPEFPGFQKLMPLESIKKKVTFPMYASEKFDGVFACAFKFGEDFHIFSRTGKEYTSMNHIAKALKEQWPGTCLSHTGFIFEVYAFDTPQPVISGWARDTKEQHPELVAMLHRVVNFESGQIILSNPKWHFDYPIYCVQHDLVAGLETAMEKAEAIWKSGGEGLVLDDTDLKYYPSKRNAHCIKVKQKETYDLLVLGVQEGKGKFTGMVGSLVCQFGDGTQVTCGGMTDLERKAWWRNPSLVSGKIVEVMAMRGSSKGVLREPRFKRIREDKNTADWSVERKDK